MWNRFLKSYFLIASGTSMVLLAVIGAETMPLKRPATAYQDSISLTKSEVTTSSIETPVESTTTTNSTVAEVTTTVPEITTTEAPIVVVTTVTTRYIPPRTTKTEPYVATMIPVVRTSGSDGPPHNTTSLVGCISWYESNWGADPNVFQFTQGTWAAYGGTGSPSNASYSTQEAIFWLAWNDDGPHHWAAQKGRCF